MRARVRLVFSFCQQIGEHDFRQVVKTAPAVVEVDSGFGFTDLKNNLIGVEVEDEAVDAVKLYEVDFEDGYSMVILGRRKPSVDEANEFLAADRERMKCGNVVHVTDEISEEDARMFYDFTNRRKWAIFPTEGGAK